MKQMYAMRRANGDWFAMDKQGRLHVPVFKSLSAALHAHWRNPGMMLFRPAVLDERALKELAPTDKSSTVGFWLVNDPTALPSRGSPLEHAQLALLVRDLSARQTAPHPDTGHAIARSLPRNDCGATATCEDEGGRYSKITEELTEHSAVAA